MLLRVLLILLLASPALAQSVVPTRTIRANAIILESDVTLRNATTANGFVNIADVVGQESRIVLYPGRPIMPSDIGPPAIVTRNQIVRMAYAAHGLEISTEGRALERGAIGDMVRIMNLSSRATVVGRVLEDGSVRVRP